MAVELGWHGRDHVRQMLGLAMGNCKRSPKADKGLWQRGEGGGESYLINNSRPFPRQFRDPAWWECAARRDHPRRSWRVGGAVGLGETSGRGRCQPSPPLLSSPPQRAATH